MKLHFWVAADGMASIISAAAVLPVLWWILAFLIVLEGILLGLLGILLYRR